MREKIIVLTCALLFASFPGWGQNFHDLYADTSDFFSRLQDPNTGLTTFPILSIPAGGEYEAMGTAYTAAARDSSFFDANPAASALLEQTEISFLHNNWIADTSIEGLAWTRRDKRLGYAVAGKFLYVPFTSYDLWGRRVSSGYYSETVAMINAAWNFVENFSIQGIAVGANLKGAFRHVPEQIASGQSAIGVMLDLGVLARFNFLKFFSSRGKNFSVGAVLRNLGPPVLDEPLPTVFSAGLAWSVLRPLLFSADINIPISLMPDVAPAEALGFAAGFSLTLTNFLSFQGGFLLKGGNPRISLGSQVMTDTFIFVANYSVDLTTQFNQLDRFSLQVKLNLGDEGRRALAAKVENLYLKGLEAFAGGESEKAIALFTEALQLDPGFTPAAETLQTVQRSVELQKRMEELQRIE